MFEYKDEYDQDSRFFSMLLIVQVQNQCDTLTTQLHHSQTALATSEELLRTVQHQESALREKCQVLVRDNEGKSI